MGDVTVEDFKKSVQKVLDIWSQPFPDLAREMDKLQDEINELEKNKKPNDADKKKLNELKAKRTALCKEIEAKIRDAELSKAIQKPIPKPPADPKPFDMLPDLVKDMIKKKGIPLGKHGAIQPIVKFDFKKMQFTEGGAMIKWTF